MVYTVTSPSRSASGKIESMKTRTASRASGSSFVSGRHSFSAIRSAGDSGLFKGSGGALTPIDSSAAGISFDGLSINASGSVAYTKANAITFEFDTIYVWSGATGVTPAVSATGPPHSSFGRLQMNDSADIAFVSFLDAGGAGIFTTGAGPVGAAIPNTDVVGINNSSQVMFVASDGSLFLDTATGSPVLIVDGSILGVVMASLNNHGDVAFLGFDPSGTLLGIFRGPDPVADKVIAVGDTLFGSTVRSLSIWREALNDSGDIAFAYGLDNLESGIAVAHGVPEPSLALLLAAAGLWFIHSRRR